MERTIHASPRLGARAGAEALGRQDAWKPMGLREFTSTKKGKVVVVLVFIGSLVALYFSIRSSFSSAAADAANRVFIDAESGKTFTHTIRAGETLPVVSPSSGKNTGYEAEMCYWTSDGKPKETPTYVLLNVYKGSRDPTFCPDCGRLVTGHNPAPAPGMSAPPTKDQYAATRRRSARPEASQ